MHEHQVGGSHPGGAGLGDDDGRGAPLDEVALLVVDEQFGLCLGAREGPQETVDRDRVVGGVIDEPLTQYRVAHGRDEVGLRAGQRGVAVGDGNVERVAAADRDEPSTPTSPAGSSKR
nr:hypothetical protein [Tessaracoccus coleopterorum]